jgi:hypothetical protein
VATAPAAHALPARQLTTAEQRPLVLTTSQAQKATGFAGTLAPGVPTAFKCGVQPDNHARFCSRIWDSTSNTAHPVISTVASFASAAAARAQILSESGNAKQVGTVVKQSATYLLFSFEGPPDVGSAAIAQQAIGSTYAYAWCGSAPGEPSGLVATCAANLLAAQVAKARSH